ncbi:hypothetical protein GQ53DRAFT_628821, partial [Thozetella sp. PMI_491]
FMSQSLVWTDNLLFAIGPLGVITAIVCAIRVGGPHWLKAFIGRGREPKSEVEKELMSSTSAEVCEMWNGNSLVRVVGQSRVVGLALVFDEDGRRLKRHRSKDGADNSSESLVTTPLLGSSPNISLNYQVSHNVTELAWFALLSILLQGVVLAIDGLLTYYWAYTNNGQAVSSAAFPLLVIGTGLLTIGLYLCSFIIQDGTRETRLRLRSENDGREVRLFWLQQRGRVGDQHFGSYAIFAADGRRDIILSEREDYFEGTDNTTNREPLTIRSFTIALLTVVASFLSIVGYVVQFIAFRQMHWFAAVLQLILCLVMTGIRAWVRRYFAEQPRTEALPENHELDWLA